MITSNRINTPEVGEAVLAEGCADMVSMARPFLADADFVAKAARGEAHRIAPCIACNQACLDHTFSGKLSSCLVNPRACHETELVYTPTDAPRRVAVVGAGPAGLSTALVAAERGHDVTLFEKDSQIGGQLNLARQIPGKEEFHGLVEWFETEVAASGLDLRLDTEATAETLADFDAVIIATGVTPRDPGIPGQDHANTFYYKDILSGVATAGDKVAIVGAGGIGFDVAEYLVFDGESPTENLPEWLKEWGVSDPEARRGGLAEEGPQPTPPARQVTLLQRKEGRPGKGLGKTTGWIHRASLAMKQVTMVGGATYERIDETGLHITASDGPKLVEADTIVLCAGQEPHRPLADLLEGSGKDVYVIGGADVAAELDAKRAIDQGARIAAVL